MFPLNWNIPFIRKNGSRTTLGNIIENASSELPPHSAGDAGKLLGVKADGSVEWSNTVNSEIQTLTNKVDELTELLPNKYIASVASDGTKTISDIIAELITDITSKIASIDPSCSILFSQIFIAGIGLFTVSTIVDGGLTNIGQIRAMRFDNTSTGVALYSLFGSSASGSINKTKIETTGTTLDVLTNNVPTSGTSTATLMIL